MVEQMIQFRLNEKLFLKDPQSTELGKRILSGSIELIDEIGLERFTFRKLATKIETAEASIYRYFENKHKLLVYLIAWYWRWLEFQIVFHTHNIEDPKERLRKTIRIVSSEVQYDPTFEHIDESALYRIVISESDKTFMTKHVDADNKDGIFKGFKSMVGRIASIIEEIAPEYPWAASLSSMLVEAAHHQVYFTQHLPSLSSFGNNGRKCHEEVENMLNEMVLRTIGAKV